MTAPRRPLQPISWWTVVIGVAAVVTAMWASTTWLLAEADRAPPGARGGLRIDAIRTGLSVGDGSPPTAAV
ncbi:hypothetical protein [Nonomuraea sp. LPB2021202275-12-8]|uniref:hypothetical protein n=1 Tax=Nonomuraea sp. LPB2021202275-12-8 TaxID=3120159 RepID=UPI00300C39DD